MMARYYYQNFAQTYGGGTYNSTTYGQSTGTGSGSATTGSGLPNTGIAIAGVVTIAAVVLLITMIIRIWRRPGKQVAPEIVETEESADPDEADEDPNR